MPPRIDPMQHRWHRENEAAGNPPVPEVIIIGGGFGGIQVARRLAGKPVHVTILDRHNFHTFLPLLYQVATAGLEPADVAYPIRTIFGKADNVSFRHGVATSVDHERKVVGLADGAELSFDHLVIASGATAAYFGIPGASQYAWPLYTLADARKLRNHLLLALEAAEVRGTSAEDPLTFVVVGGGPTGVETAGSVSELLEICIRRDRMDIDPASTRVILLDVAPKLLAAFPESASEYAAKALAKKGVEIRLGASVVEVDGQGVTLEGGERLDTAAVIWAAGMTAAGTMADYSGADPGPAGRVKVNPDLSVGESHAIWSVGDCAAVPSFEEEGKFYPQLAPVAIQTGRHCAEQILNVIAGQPTKPFKYRNKGIMATIGRRAAVASLPKGPVIKGTLGWLSWLGLHLFYLVGFRNRINVMINWTWRYLDWPSGPRLIVADAEPVD